jgi:hypothetical protein
MACVRALLIGPAFAFAFAGAARAEPLSACVFGKLSAGEHAKVLAAYQQSMAAGAQALERLSGKLKAATATCAKRGDVPADWVSTLAGAEAVQTFVAAALKMDRDRLDAAWAAAPAHVATCIRANGRLAFYPNGTGCVDPAASAWLLRRIGLAPNQPPASQQANYYFNAKAIGEWGDQLIAKLPPKAPRSKGGA